MNFNKEITSGDLEIVDRLIEFIKVASNGIVKPYSHDHYLKSIRHLTSGQGESCCPPSTEVREGKELKPY